MLCASQASTTNLCSTMDGTSQPSSSATVRLGGRAIDRHNPIIRDGSRLLTPPASPHLNNSSSSSSSSSTYHTPLKTRLGLGSSEQRRVAKRKSKKGDCDVANSPTSCFSSDTPKGSSRSLLSNPVLFDGFVDSNPIPLPIDEPEITRVKVDDFHDDRLIINASKYLSSSSSSSFLEKKPPDFFDGFLDYEPVLSPDNPFSAPTKASPTASLSSHEDKEVSSPDFKFSTPPPHPPPPPPPSPPQSSPPPPTDSSSDQVNHPTKPSFGVTN